MRLLLRDASSRVVFPRLLKHGRRLSNWVLVLLIPGGRYSIRLLLMLLFFILSSLPYATFFWFSWG